MQRIAQRHPMPPMDAYDRRHVRRFNWVNWGMAVWLVAVVGIVIKFVVWG
jgi:hypothetical protein